MCCQEAISQNLPSCIRPEKDIVVTTKKTAMTATSNMRTIWSLSNIFSLNRCLRARRWATVATMLVRILHERKITRPTMQCVHDPQHESAQCKGERDNKEHQDKGCRRLQLKFDDTNGVKNCRPFSSERITRQRTLTAEEEMSTSEKLALDHCAAKRLANDAQTESNN